MKLEGTMTDYEKQHREEQQKQEDKKQRNVDLAIKIQDLEHVESHKDPAYEYTAKDFNDFRQVRAIKTVDILEIEEMIFASLLSFVLPVLNWQKMEEENSKQEAKFLTEREEAKTDEVLKVQKSVKTIFRLLRLGAPPEDISEKRNLIIVGELIDLCMVSWYYLLTVWNI
jgi:hypothetical protein